MTGVSTPWARWLLLGASGLLLSIPFFGIGTVPMTDLPQHLGQLRLFAAAIGQPDGALAIQWWTPYSLVYGLMALPWLLLSPLVAAKVAALSILLTQAAGVQALSASAGRPWPATVLATTFALNQIFYWGFVNFLFGWAVFVLWFCLTRSDRDASRWRAGLLFLLAATALYFSHALWFAIGLSWLVIESLVSRRPWRQLTFRLVAVFPVIALAVVWFSGLRSSSFATDAAWGASPLGRLDLGTIVPAALGGIRHPLELVIVVVALLWIAAALIARRREPGFGCDRHLLALTAVFLTLYCLLPDKYVNTICFNSRWLPYAFMTGLLAVGRPPLPKWLGRGLVGALMAGLVLLTAVAWRGVEREELSGVDLALAQLPERPRRVLGLSFMEPSRFLWVSPFAQTFAWAQVVRGGELNFSFAYFATSPVIYQDLDRVVWSKNLVSFPRSLARADFAHFDYALVGGDAETHRRMASFPELDELTEGARWRLYRVSTAGAGPP